VKGQGHSQVKLTWPAAPLLAELGVRNINMCLLQCYVHSVLWHCQLGDGKGVQSEKISSSNP